MDKKASDKLFLKLPPRERLGKDLKYMKFVTNRYLLTRKGTFA